MSAYPVLTTLLVLSAIVLFATMSWTLWRLLKTIERLSARLEGTLVEFETTAEEVRKTNSVFHEILSHAERGAANVEHVTEGVRKLRKTLDAATGVLDFVAVPVLGNVAGVLAGSKAGMSYAWRKIFRKGGRHGE